MLLLFVLATPRQLLPCLSPDLLAFIKVEGLDSFCFDEAIAASSEGGPVPVAPVAPSRRSVNELQPCFVRLVDLTYQCKLPAADLRVPALTSSLFYGRSRKALGSSPAAGSARTSRKDLHGAARTSPLQGRGRSRSVAPSRPRARSGRSLSRCSSRSQARGQARSRSVAPSRPRVRSGRSLSRCSSRSQARGQARSRSVAPSRPRDKSVSRLLGMPNLTLGRGKAPARDVLKCGLCLMPFHLQSSLKKHVQGHQERFPDRCLVCGAGVAGLADAVQHFLSHPDAAADLVVDASALREEPAVRCRLCPQRYSQRRRSSLPHHVLSHTGELPFKCASCQDRFRTLYSRSRHAERIHGARDAGTSKGAAVVQRVRRLGPSASTPSSLQARGLDGVHPANGPLACYSCYYCPQEVGSLVQLKHHIVSAHGAARPHGCARCPKRFATPKDALRHEARHSSEFKCSLCGDRFSSAKSCLAHVGQKHRGGPRRALH